MQVSEFDKVFGDLPDTTPTAAGNNLSFGDAFDDQFNFTEADAASPTTEGLSSASSSAFPPPPTSAGGAVKPSPVTLALRTRSAPSKAQQAQLAKLTVCLSFLRSPNPNHSRLTQALRLIYQLRPHLVPQPRLRRVNHRSMRLLLALRPMTPLVSIPHSRAVRLGLRLPGRPQSLK